MKSTLAFVILILSGLSAFATVYHSDGSAINVQFIHDTQAQNGDTITLPTGTFSWATGVTITKIITLQGQGTGTGGGDQTVIIDNYALGLPLLNFRVGSTGVFRMTGITVRSGSGSIKDGGTININGPSNVRIDHCHLIATSTANYKMILFDSGVFGLMDHCILDFTGTNALYFYNGRRGAGDWMGNLEWSLPTAFGSADYFFIEDNIINGNVGSGPYSTRIFDGFTAARVVVRFNTVSQAVLGETHATGHAPDDRGLRSQEVYGNSVTSSLAHAPNYCALDMGNGTTLIWGNSWDQVYKNIYLFKQTRKNNATYNQIPTPNGWGYAGTEFNGTGSMWDGGTALGTDTTKGYPCLNQPGRGQGDLITGGFPNKINSTTGTIYWPHQALEPIYIWNNTGGIVSGWGGNTYANDSGGRVVANRDYYPSASGAQTSPTSPFNGSSGTGWGTLANRPTTCTPGVAYFATDQGSWNTSTSNPYGVQQNGADGVLYKCTAPNTWTLYYTPYTYPHPLAAGGSPSPTPTPTPTPAPTPGGPRTDFNGDGKPDYVLYNAGTQQTAVWYLNNNLYIGGAFTPTLPAGWIVVSAADFNRDGHPDYALFRPSTRQTVIWYFSGVTRIGSTYGPTPPGGWALVATGGDFNNDGKSDYVLYNASTRQTVVWYLNNNVHIGGAYGPTLPAGWSLVGVADFNRDGKPDYLLFNPSTRQTAIFYLSGTTWIGTASGPTPPAGWRLVGVADFNRDGKPDYLLFNASTRQTVIWYMNNNVRIGGAYGPTLPAGWTVAAP